LRAAQNLLPRVMNRDLVETGRQPDGSIDVRLLSDVRIASCRRLPYTWLTVRQVRRLVDVLRPVKMRRSLLCRKVGEHAEYVNPAKLSFRALGIRRFFYSHAIIMTCYHDAFEYRLVSFSVATTFAPFFLDAVGHAASNS